MPKNQTIFDQITYVYSQPLDYEQDMTQGEFLSE